MKTAFALLLGSAIAYGSDKGFGGATNRLMQVVGRFAGSVATNVFTSVERATGCAAMVKTGGGDCTISMPDNAVVADNIAKRGAHDDAFGISTPSRRHWCAPVLSAIIPSGFTRTGR